MLKVIISNSKRLYIKSKLNLHHCIQCGFLNISQYCTYIGGYLRCYLERVTFCKSKLIITCYTKHKYIKYLYLFYILKVKSKKKKI